jgi:hypothetical protein
MPSSNEADWRLAGQERYLTGAVFQLRRYSPPSADWDHDHCEFCWVKFSSPPNNGEIDEGYVTSDGKHWVCQGCFRDFRERFSFSDQPALS